MAVNIIVLIKQVPRTSDVKIDPKTGSLLREGVASILNPEDRYGLEAALHLKEEHAGRVVAVTMGPPQAIDVISEALGLGADQGVLLTDPFFAGADTWATAFTLTLALQNLQPFDLIIAGRQAIDGDTAQIGPQVAEGLGLPQATYVQDLRLEQGRLVAQRLVEDGLETVDLPLPALVTVIKSTRVPRQFNIPKLLAACRPQADIMVWNAADIGARADQTGLAGSYTRVVKTYSPKIKREGVQFSGSADEIAQALITAWRDRHLIGGFSWP